MSFIKSKKIFLIVLVVVIGAGILFSRDDNALVITEVENSWVITNLYHIELFDDKKAVVFFETIDGSEREVYLEKTIFKWHERRGYMHEPEGIDEPLHLSFSESPFKNEEDLELVVIRVYDTKINNVEIRTTKGLLKNIKIQPKRVGKTVGFGLVRIDDKDILEAEFVSYNAEGKFLYSVKLES
ncbi:hypothetical protein [Sporosarcina sp. E16_8]|uniref:hypothetical protein n=1 Tax=Sporosarcina sp. E16_8 TaxID=2789295 RepID=UPI001A92537D|nr:hypothetical protein [Sporosarcina sp. E16_8]MBO0588084.1 hypothetical protein [Sporosarcina sp. E16_8]